MPSPTRRMPPNEMRDRVGKLLGGKEVNAATFHDYCLDMLKRVGKDFGVLDEKDLWIYLRRRIRELRLQHYIRAANVAQFLERPARIRKPLPRRTGHT